ncbi:hypothetical protein SLA2020_238750 [Shorea laevis]
MNMQPMVSWQPSLEIPLRSILIQQYRRGMAEPGLELSLGCRNCDSKVIRAAQRTCGLQEFVLQAEVMAIDFALHMGREFGHRNVIIELDCLKAIRVAVPNDDCYLPFGAMVEEIRAKKFHFLSVFPACKACVTC